MISLYEYLQAEPNSPAARLEKKIEDTILMLSCWHGAFEVLSLASDETFTQDISVVQQIKPILTDRTRRGLYTIFLEAYENENRKTIKDELTAFAEFEAQLSTSEPDCDEIFECEIENSPRPCEQLASIRENLAEDLCVQIVSVFTQTGLLDDVLRIAEDSKLSAVTLMNVIIASVRLSAVTFAGKHETFFSNLKNEGDYLKALSHQCVQCVAEEKFAATIFGQEAVNSLSALVSGIIAENVRANFAEYHEQLRAYPQALTEYAAKNINTITQSPEPFDLQQIEAELLQQYPLILGDESLAMTEPEVALIKDSVYLYGLIETVVVVDWAKQFVKDYQVKTAGCFITFKSEEDLDEELTNFFNEKLPTFKDDESQTVRKGLQQQLCSRYHLTIQSEASPRSSVAANSTGLFAGRVTPDSPYVMNSSSEEDEDKCSHQP